jgi:hypothetical protein
MDYVALTTIYAPGTSVAGYQRGHAVPEDVVENWSLAVGTDVAEGATLPEDGAGATAQRPGPEATRVTWERWAVANGMSEDDAAVAAQEALEKVEAASPSPEVEPVADDAPVRPADSAPKADWVAYVVDSGGDPQWAGDSATTKANLQAWTPALGDTVAVAATEANQA